MPETPEEEEYEFPGNEWITPTSCILCGSYLASAPGMSDAFYAFDNFGGAVSFCRHTVLEEEAANYEGGKQHSQEEVDAYQQEAGNYFDALLERFVRDGYQPEMKDALLKGIEKYFRVYQLGSIYVLPDDLDDLLDYTGNPFTGEWATYAEDDWEDDEEDQRFKATFDLNNPDHCAALWYSLYEKTL